MCIDFDGHHSGGSSFVYVNDFCYYRNYLYTNRYKFSSERKKNRQRVPVYSLVPRTRFGSVILVGLGIRGVTSSGSKQLSLHFSLSKSCIFLNRCLCLNFSMTNAVQYIYVYFHFVYIQITIHWSFQSCSFICNKSFKHKSCISQISFHFALKRI